MLFDDAAHRPRVGEILVVFLLFLQVVRNGGAPVGFLNHFDGVRTISGRDPFDGLIRIRAGGPGDQGNLVCHHESTIKTDTKLSDQFRN